MKTSVIKTILALALILLLLAPACALGAVRYPAAAGALTDDANALGQTMAADVAAYAEKVESAVGVKLHVALVLFLDGETAQTYADTLFSRWVLGEDDLLLLGAAAEDTFAVSSGANVQAKCSDAALNELLYSSGFAESFQNQRYDAAFGGFFVAFNDLLYKQYGQSIELDELFAAYQPSAEPTASPTAAPQATDALQSAVDAGYALWTSTMDSIGDSVQSYRDQRHDRDEGGLTTGGWIVLVILVLIVLSQTGPARRARRGGGCGCSPIGWLLGGLGLGTLIDRHRDERGRGCRRPRRR